MAKKKVVATKRFTKKTIYEYNLGDEADYRLLVQNAINFNRNQMSFEDRLKSHVESAKKILLSKSLPTTTKLYQVEYPDKSIQFEETIPPGSKQIGITFLLDYLKELGFMEDSTEYLAAEVLLKCEKFFHPDTKESKKISLAYDIGVNVTIAMVYMSEVETKSANAKKPRNPLMNIIEILSKRDGTVRDLWSSLITIMENKLLDPEVATDDNGNPVIHYFDDKAKKRHITYKSFSNRLSEFRNKSR